jgi:protein TonB
MKHWPSFEPFEEARESGKFLALWPSVEEDAPEETVSAISFGPERVAAKGADMPAPPIVDPAGEASQPARLRGRRFPRLLLLLSLAAHAAALVLTAHFLTQPGVEAETEAISVEIVVEAPPVPTTDPSLAGEATAEADKAQDAKEEKVVEKAISVPPPPISLPPTPPDIDPAPAVETAAVEVPKPEFSLPSEPPAFAAPQVLATERIAEMKVPAPALVLPDAPPEIEAEQPARSATKMGEAVPAPALKLPDAAPPIPDEAGSSVALPEKASPPAPAPDQPNPVRRVEKPAPVKEYVKPVPSERKPEEKPAPNRKVREHQASQSSDAAGKAAKRPSSAGVGKAAGRGSIASRGGASAGEKALYAARLRSHVQRFERYPAEAERNGVAGSARILITIDRGGRLVSSRLAAGSGSAILDEAAKATAERASPYPPPPDGIGGRTLTFAATVRFRR